MSLLDRLLRPRYQNPDEVRMTLGEHLEELRSRVIRALLGLALGTIVCYFISDYIMAFLTWPVIAIQRAHGLETNLKSLNPPEIFLMYLKVSIIVGIIVSAPYSLMQVWGFVAAGLYPHERGWVRRFAPVSIALFFAGALFLLMIAAPLLINFLSTYGTKLPDIDRVMPTWLIPKSKNPIATRPSGPPETAVWPASLPAYIEDPKEPPERAPWINLQDRKIRFRIGPHNYEADFKEAGKRSEIVAEFRLSEYIIFILHLALAFGIGFQVPVIVAFLAVINVASAAQMGHFRRHVWFVIAIVAAVLTPPDVTSMLCLLMPMSLLFEIGLVAARRIERRRAAV